MRDGNRSKVVHLKIFFVVVVELSQIFTINTYDFYNQKENGKQVPPLVRG